MSGTEKASKKKDINRDEDTAFTVEEGFEKLDGIIERLEDEEITLEEAFSAFEEGMKILKITGDKIDAVEKKVRIINEEGELDEFQ